MSSAEVAMAINNELKRKPVRILDNVSPKQIKVDIDSDASSYHNLNNKHNTKNATAYIPTYTHLDNTQSEKYNSSKFSELLQHHYINQNNKTRFVTEPPEPVAVDYCETCNYVLQHCKGCLDHTKLCGNPHCGNRQKGTTFCVACKGLDEYHPICRNCVEYPPYTAQTNQCAHCKGYFCAASLSNPSLKYTCSECDSMVCWRCRSVCNHNNTKEGDLSSKASVNIDILMK